MSKLCVTTKCKYCEAVFIQDELFRYRCIAQAYTPWVYPNVSDCPYENVERADMRGDA